MIKGSKLRSSMGAATAVGLSLSLASSSAHAYNARTHQEMTNFAYNVMRMVAYQDARPDGSHRTPTLIPDGDVSLWTAPNGADPAQWKAFLDKVADSHWRILHAPAGLPNVGDCLVDNQRLHQLPNYPVPNTDNPELHIGFHEQMLHKSRAGDRACRQDERRGSLINDLNAAFPHGQIAGSALGVHASDPDYYDLDWKVFFNPLAADGSALTGKSFIDLTDKAFAAGLGVALAPIFCLVRIFKGKSCSIDDIRDFSDRANPLPQVRGLLAAPIGAATAFKPSTYGTGLGHLMNLSPKQVGTFDDLSGFHQERSGYAGQPGQVDLEMMVAGDLLGITVEPTKSRGARDYEICKDQFKCDHNEVRDDHPKSSRRTNARWRSQTIGHTQFTPLDNMAYYGWQKAMNYNFPDVQLAPQVIVAPADLARPLHALGDAAAPHHMIAGLGWGHRPFEVTIEDSWSSVQLLHTGSTREQYQNMRTILVEAFYWWNYIQQWRASFQPSYDRDIPIRNMITKMVRRNYSYIVSGDEDTFDNGGIVPAALLPPVPPFPYFDTLNDWIGDFYDSGWRSANKDKIAHLINNSVAGSVAFLTAAGESMGPSFCGDSMVETKEECDDDNSANGDGCSANCKVEAGYKCDEAWPSACIKTSVCGNGIIEPGEVCDGGSTCANCTVILI